MSQCLGLLLLKDEVGIEMLNMPHRSRLGLWGPGSAFNDFQAFLDSMKKRGVSFLEMLAMEMKSQGYYVARGLSFRYGLHWCSHLITTCTFPVPGLRSTAQT